MHERDPRRLKQEEGTPDALVKALQALRKGPDDSARLARVSKRLEPMLDAPPPAAPALEPTPAPAFIHPSLLKLVVAGLAVVAPLLWLARMQWPLPAQPSAAQPSAIQAPAQSVQPSAPSPTVAEPVPQPPVHQMPAADSGGPSTRTRGPFAPGRASRKRGPNSTRNASDAQTRSAQASPAAAAESAAAPEQPAGTAQPEQPQAAHPPIKPEAQKRSTLAAQPKPAVVSGSVPRTASESELLFDARKALPDDAELALRLLTEHAARFPKGQLVPEREVLAIEALRRLGRTQEADARLQRFQARYPNSLHLQRLQH